MLHNPRHDLTDIHQFIAFLESKPANETYPYMNPQRCAIAQFAQSKLATYEDVPHRIRTRWNCYIAIPPQNKSEETFGVAAKRARAYAARTTKDDLT